MFPYWPRSIENRSALRTAIAALTAILISFKFHLETPYWSGMTVVVVTNLYTGSIIDKAMMRIIGTIAGAFLGFYVAGMVANSFLLYFLSCFLIIAVAVYYYSYSTYGYAYLLGALCAFIVISQLALNPQNAFLVAIWRPVEIGIGVLVSAISAYVIFPNHLKDTIPLQVHDIFDGLITEFNQLAAGIVSGPDAFSDLAETNLKVKKQIRKAVELIGALNHELGVTKERTDELRALLDSFYSLTRQIHYLIITAPESKDLIALQGLSIDLVFSAIHHDLLSLQAAFVTNPGAPVNLQIHAAIQDLEHRFNQSRTSYSVQSDFIYSFIHFLDQVQRGFVVMQSFLVGALVLEAPQYEVMGKQERLRADYDLMKQSIKAGLSVILALVFWLVSNWPGGLNGIISSLMISIRKNLYEMKNISIHRVLGCFLGGGVALCSLYFLDMNLSQFLFILFCSVWAFTYFMFKVPKYSYIGLQANIALIISLAQEGGPPVVLDPPLQRLGGIMIGIAASFIVANVLWRTDVWTILNRYLTKLYHYMTFNLKQVLLAAEGQLALHDLANLFWISRGLLESLADESLSSSDQMKLKELAKRFDELVITQATISHLVLTVNRDKAQNAARQIGFDLSDYAKKLVMVYEQHDASGALLLNQELKKLLYEVEKKQAQINDDDLRVLLAYINALIQLASRAF